MTGAADFHVEYAAALRAHLEAQDEDTLAVGHELGRRALQEQISILAIVENHSRLVDALGTVVGEAPIRHRDGHLVWVAMSVNAVTSPSIDGDTGHTYVGTIRDVTAARSAAERERAVAHLATAVSVAKSVGEVLSAMLDECRTALGVQHVAAVMWPTREHDPTVHPAGTSRASQWDDLDPPLRRSLEDARAWLPLAVEPIESAPGTDTSSGIAAALSRDVILWLGFGEPPRGSPEDRQLVTPLVGHP